MVSELLVYLFMNIKWVLVIEYIIKRLNVYYHTSIIYIINVCSALVPIGGRDQIKSKSTLELSGISMDTITHSAPSNAS